MHFFSCVSVINKLGEKAIFALVIFVAPHPSAPSALQMLPSQPTCFMTLPLFYNGFINSCCLIL